MNALTARLRRYRPSATGVFHLAVASLVGLLAIIPSGALVRLTDSGLGCPDWPGCHGQVVPPLSGHAWIEYSNRVLSGVVVIVAVVAWVAVLRLPGAPRHLRRWAALPALAGLAQGPLGGLTVLSDLHPLLVSSHFLLSIVALAGGTVFALVARDHHLGRARAIDRARARLALATSIALLGVVVTGVLVTAAGPHSGDPKVIRRLGNLADAAAIHVRVVIGFSALAIALAIWLWRVPTSDPLTRRLALLFVPLLAAQIALGEYQYRHHLPWKVILIHVTLAGALWAAGVAIAWLSSRPWIDETAEDIQLAERATPLETDRRQASIT